MAKIKKLKYNPETEYHIIGLSTSEDDYKVSWLINKNTNIQLQRTDNLEVRDDNKTDILVFSVFKGHDGSNGFKIKLVSNKCPEGYLINELKNIDIFIVIFCTDTNYSSKLTTELKKFAEINAVFNIDKLNLKSKEKLLF